MTEMGRRGAGRFSRRWTQSGGRGPSLKPVMDSTSSPRLPMVDLPQHAAQVVMLRDLLLSASAWTDLVEINLGTPYLAGYLLALPLTLVMPVSTALSAVLSLSLAGMIAASVALREEAGADARLDWLFLPAFFGLAWKWGYYH